MGHALNISASLRDFLIKNIGLDASFTDQTPLFSGGYIDSIDLADLVAFVNERFGVIIPPSGFTVENLDTVESQARCILSLQARSSGR